MTPRDPCRHLVACWAGIVFQLCALCFLALAPAQLEGAPAEQAQELQP